MNKNLALYIPPVSYSQGSNGGILVRKTTVKKPNLSGTSIEITNVVGLPEKGIAVLFVDGELLEFPYNRIRSK